MSETTVSGAPYADPSKRVVVPSSTRNAERRPRLSMWAAKAVAPRLRTSSSSPKAR